MSKIAVRVESLSKRYFIGRMRARHDALREVVVDAVTAPFRRAARLLRGQATGAAELDEVIWALRDVSFTVKQGEVIGIIGRNGAGKSTLLKVLSRITEPDAGCADLYGRVGSLLEVGAGFHDELTGRENIYLNGAILGMRRAEIDRKFDEIVEFADIARFVDTPVKHYSSGMYLRLGFAVAAHLETEILFVDEVLAVGDARFQKKCLSKMQDVGRQGRTVFFVSHNMPAITRLCERVLLLEEGRLLADGPAHQVVGAYLNAGLGTTAARAWADRSKAPGDEVVRLRAVRVCNAEGQISETFDIRQPVKIEMEYEVLIAGYDLMPHYHLYTDEGIHAFTTLDTSPDWQGRPRPAGRYLSSAWVPGNFLAEGTVFVEVGIVTNEPRVSRVYERDVVAFQVIDSQDGSTARGRWVGRLGGAVRPLLKWETQVLPNGQNAAAAPASGSLIREQ
jgi:lipopolysaccharide transport system ATP-binding protein